MESSRKWKARAIGETVFTSLFPLRRMHPRLPEGCYPACTQENGVPRFNTPYIDPMRNPCVMCTDLPCISACPDEALLPVQELTDVNMGYAILDKKKCQAYGESFCQQCVIDCPVPGAIFQVDDKPVIDKNICTGCGVCMRSCSTVNIPLAIKIKPQMVVEYQLHKNAKNKNSPKSKLNSGPPHKPSRKNLSSVRGMKKPQKSRNPDPPFKLRSWTMRIPPRPGPLWVLSIVM